MPPFWIVLALAVILLLAVGADYNLLLISRFKEEMGAGLNTGIVRAMAGAGGVGLMPATGLKREAQLRGPRSLARAVAHHRVRRERASRSGRMAKGIHVLPPAPPVSIPGQVRRELRRTDPAVLLLQPL